MTTHASASLHGGAAVAADDAEAPRAALLGELDGAHDVRRDALLRLPPPTEKTSSASRAPSRETFSQAVKDGVPALVVDARGQLGDVVGRRVGLEAAELAEVVDGVAGVPGRAAHAEDEEPAAVVAHRAQAVGDRVDGACVESAGRAFELGGGNRRSDVRRSQLYPAASASRKNICTVSRLKSLEALPSSGSLARRSGVAVMMSQPIRPPDDVEHLARAGPEQLDVLVGGPAVDSDSASAAGSRPVSAMRPAKTETTEGGPPSSAARLPHLLRGETAVTFTLHSGACEFSISSAAARGGCW